MLPVVSEEARTVFKDGLIGDTRPELSTYMNAIARRHKIAREWCLFMERYPSVLGPVSTQQPFEVGFDLQGREAVRRLIHSMILTELCNLLGLPSVAMPVDVVGGLPQGVQLIGPRYHEDLCFDAAEVVERELGILTPIDASVPHV